MVGKATTGSSFSGLASYLTQKEERVAWTEARWMISADPKEVAREMEAAAALATSRLEKPVYHVSISFSETDHPTRAQMQAAADRVLHELGLEKHQAFLVAHQDKGHPHLHVMVNRVHPDTGRVADVSFDYRKIETVLRELEKEWGMTRVPGHHARAAGEEAPDRAQALSTGEVRQARRTGASPFPQEIRARMGGDLTKAIEDAKSWDELREALGRHGYRIEPTEHGMKITDGERYAKASRVDERLGRLRLEERFSERLVRRTNGTTKGDAALPSERAAGKTSGRPPVYESLFGKPALERGEGMRGGGPGQLLGAAAVAARPVSSEDGEKEAPLRALEVGLRGAAALAGRSEASHLEPGQPEQKQAAEKQLEAETRMPERSASERTDVTQPERTTGSSSEQTTSPEARINLPTDPDRSGLQRTRSANQNASSLPTPSTQDLEVRRLMRDVQAYERGVKAEQSLSAAAGAYAEVELRWKAAQRQGQEVARLSQTFDRALGEAYLDPAAARQAFEALGEQKGPGAAARAMRQEPEQFGAVIEVAQKKWMGLATEVSKAEGYAAARGAANVGEQYLHSRAALLGARPSSDLEATLAAKGAEMKALRQELHRIGQPSALLERIGKQARGFTSAQMYGLSRVLTPEQLGVVMRAAGISVRIARGYGR